MKICYLILAHNNFTQLDRLLVKLADENSRCYVHIDPKSNQLYIPPVNNVEIIPERINIRWGGFSMVEATIALLKYGIDHFPEADYYALISGVDYPIRPKSFLTDQLNTGKEFIDILPAPAIDKPIERYNHYFFDYNRRQFNSLNPKGIVERLLKLLKYKRNPPFKIYVGSQWFFLTHDCVLYILDTIIRNKEYIRFFKHTLVPDEAFFQTIIGNSPFFKRTTANLTYTDWNVSIPPATINDEHINTLKKSFTFTHEYGTSHPYFARKFNDQSLDIITRIEEELRKE